MKRPLDSLLDDLRTNPVMPAQASLYVLSNLEAADGARVREAWLGLPLELRREIINRLAELAEADFEVNFGAVFRIGLDDGDAEVRTTAIEGLWEDEDVRLVPLLAARLRTDEDAGVRAAAATSLGRFVLLGELDKIRPIPKAAAYEALLAACVRGRYRNAGSAAARPRIAGLRGQRDGGRPDSPSLRRTGRADARQRRLCDGPQCRYPLGTTGAAGTLQP